MLGSPKEAELGPHPRPCGGASLRRREAAEEGQQRQRTKKRRRRRRRKERRAGEQRSNRPREGKRKRAIGEKPRTQLLKPESEGKVTETKREVDADRRQPEKLKGKRTEQVENQAPTYQRSKSHGCRQ